MAAPPAMVGTRRQLLEARRLRIGLFCLAPGVAGFVAGPVVGLALLLLALPAFLMVGFEISRPVSKRPWLDSAWASLVYGLGVATVLAPLSLLALSHVTYKGPLPRGVRTVEDIALFAGACAAGLSMVLASLHVVRRRGPEKAGRLLRHLWIPAAVTAVIFFTHGGLFKVAAVLWMIVLVVLVNTAVFLVFRPARGTGTPTLDAAPGGAAPTFRSYRGT